MSTQNRAPSGKHKPYTSSYRFLNTDAFYIHWHTACIGRAMDGSAMSDEELSKTFSNQRGAAIEFSQKYYTNLYMGTLGLTNENIALLSETLGTTKEDIIKQIDKQVKTELQKAASTDKRKALKDLELNAKTVAEKIFNKDAKEALAAFDKLLGILQETLDLLEIAEFNDALSKVMSHMSKRGTFNTQMAGNALNKELVKLKQKIAKNKNITPVNMERIKVAMRALDNLSARLITGETTTKTQVTKKNIGKVIEKMFAPNFSEIIGSMFKTTAKMSFENQVLSLTGTKGTDKVKINTSDGRAVGYYEKTKRSGKSDAKLENVHVMVSLQGGEGKNVDQTLTISLGFSDKFYTSQGFDIAEGKGLSFDSGFGGDLDDIIDKIFAAERARYLTYNMLAHQEDLPISAGTFNDLVLIRQVNQAFGTRGGSADFASYLFVNGEIVSLGDIIRYATENNHFQSSSENKNGGSSALALHIEGRQNIIKAVKKRQAMGRSMGVKNAVANSHITVTAHIDKLVQSISKI